jgi:hypothetical protein
MSARITIGRPVVETIVAAPSGTDCPSFVSARDRTWWQSEAARVGSDWSGIIAGHLTVVARLAGWPACETCGGQPCINPSFCAACRVADAAAIRHPSRAHPQPTPQVTVEALWYCFRERGIQALREPANVERLNRCDKAAREELNRRIANKMDIEK